MQEQVERTQRRRQADARTSNASDVRVMSSSSQPATDARPSVIPNTHDKDDGRYRIWMTEALSIYLRV